MRLISQLLSGSDKEGMLMLTKLKTNNKGGADLQFAVATFLFMFVVCLALLIDFWYVSSAKISVMKAVQESELYSLVTNAPKMNEAGGDDMGGKYTNLFDVNLSTNQSAAVLCTKPELNNKLETFPYLEEYSINSVVGLTDYMGQMGVRTVMRYKVKTMLRSPGQIFNFMRPWEDESELTAANWVPLTITTKLVPIVTDKNVAG